jgi:hypothetical protein
MRVVNDTVQITSASNSHTDGCTNVVMHAAGALSAIQRIMTEPDGPFELRLQYRLFSNDPPLDTTESSESADMLQVFMSRDGRG